MLGRARLPSASSRATRASRRAVSAEAGQGSAPGDLPSVSPTMRPHRGSALAGDGEDGRRTLRAAPPAVRRPAAPHKAWLRPGTPRGSGFVTPLTRLGRGWLRDGLRLLVDGGRCRLLPSSTLLAVPSSCIGRGGSESRSSYFAARQVGEGTKSSRTARRTLTRARAHYGGPGAIPSARSPRTSLVLVSPVGIPPSDLSGLDLPRKLGGDGSERTNLSRSSGFLEPCSSRA